MNSSWIRFCRYCYSYYAMGQAIPSKPQDDPPLNIWTICEIYQYIQKSIHPENFISLGTFWVLRPFYWRTETEKDIEMCCCKLHLHTRLDIETLIQCVLEQHIDIPFNNYTTFFLFGYVDKELWRKPNNVYIMVL